MIDPFFFLLFTILLLAVVGGVVYLIWHLRRNVLNPMGKGMVENTTVTLKQFGLTRGWKAIYDVTIQVNGQTAHIENLLVGYFGLLLVHTCPVRGEYYGSLDGEQWTIAMDEGRKKTTIPNPIAEQKKAIALLRALLTKHKITGYITDNVVYFTSKGKKAAFYVKDDGHILFPGKLRGYLDKTKFEQDNGLDVDKVIAVIREAKPQTD